MKTSCQIDSGRTARRAAARFGAAMMCCAGALAAVGEDGVKLTSITVEAEDANGQSLNAPGGVFSTNLGDPAPQIGVMCNGKWLNAPWTGGKLGEIAYTLQPGINHLNLFGSSSASHTGGYPYYGCMLFFDDVRTPPQVAVYNANTGGGTFSVQAAGTTVIGSANGGLWFDKAPGTSVYRAADGSAVEVVAFTVSHVSSNPDVVSWGNYVQDGHPDIVAQLTLVVTPAPTVRIVEYPIPTPACGAQDLVMDNTGNVYFTERAAKKIGKCSPSGIFTEYPVSYSDPMFLAYNPFASLIYFTEGEYGNGHYGVLRPSTGAMTEYPSGLPAASTVECTFAPDGKFWFVGWDSQSIAWADKSGNVQSYRLPNFGYTSGMSEDPQGNLWMTKVGAYENAPTLVKFNPAQAQPGTSKGFTEIPLPYDQATIRRPLAALGRIWVPMMDQSKILAYDPQTGTCQEYATPTPNATPQRLSLDRWNRLWFAESTANKIGMLNLRTGTIVEYPVPTPDSAPEFVTVDVDRDIVYFTERVGNKIGKLTLRP